MLNVFMTGNKFPKMFIYDFVSMVSVKTAVVVSNFPATVRQFNSVPPNNIDQGFFVNPTFTNKMQFMPFVPRSDTSLGRYLDF